MHKPVMDFQFDEDTFYDEHYHKGYFDYRRDGFGPVAININSVVRMLTDSVSRKYITYNINVNN